MTTLARAGQGEPLTAFKFTDADFAQIASVLHETAGIYLGDAKAPLVYARLTKRLRALGLESFREYCALILSESGVDERQRMIAALTTNVTKFFREPHHFEHFRRRIVEPKAAQLRAGKRFRIWSAACSNGQEPYSIAMTIFSVIPEAASLDIRILATDIDPNMIEAGISGEYAEDAISALAPAQVDRWFSLPAGREGVWRVNEKLASLVAFRELNLVGSWPMKGQFDAIFCRNVVIYFEEKTQQALWSRFLPLLTPDAALYIGHSERVSGPASERLVSDGVTTYRHARHLA